MSLLFTLKRQRQADRCLKTSLGYTARAKSHGETLPPSGDGGAGHTTLTLVTLHNSNISSKHPQ